MRKKIIIAGAGAAGLFAAKQLSKYFEVTVIESRSRVGGRIHSIKSSDGSAMIECGAEFVHGNLPITSSLLSDAGLTLLKMDGKMLRKEGSGFVEQEEMIEGWEELLEKMKDCPEEMTMKDFMDKYFAAEKYAALRKHVESYVGGFDLADIASVSVSSLYREWSAEEEQYRIKEGYSALIDHLYGLLQKEEVQFVLGDPVKQVGWSKDKVNVRTDSGRHFSADKILVTLPVSTMSNSEGRCAINFSPSIDRQLEAYRNIGFGTVIKIVLEFSEKFWEPDVSFYFSEEKIPTWWTQHPLDTNLLTGWAGGPAAERLQSLSADELTEVALASLAHIFNLSSGQLSNILVRTNVFNWIKSDETMGAYSFSTPASKQARVILKQPELNTLYFAGEGLFEGDYPGTVEAAFKNAADVAERILKEEGI